MKRKLFAAINVVLAVLLLSATAVSTGKAETVYSSAELQGNKLATEYIYSRPMIKHMYNFGVTYDAKFGLQTDCKSKYYVKPAQIAIFSPIVFLEGKDHPVKGVWAIRYKLERCGEEKIYNATFIADANGNAPTPHPYYPGATMADFVLVKDALTSAFFAAGALAHNAKDCKELQVFDMRPADLEKDGIAPGKPEKAWHEVWTLWLCGEQVNVPMTFTRDADGKGTSFTAGLKKGGL